MNFSFNMDEQKFADLIERRVESVQRPVQVGMAEMMKDIVISNFGPTGIDRPEPWPPLSDRSEVGRNYIKKVGRTYATLYETGLMASAVRQSDELFGSSVSLSDTDCPYATRHHDGTRTLPRRRVFPIRYDGQVTQFSRDAVIDAARQVIEEKFI